VAEEAVGAAVAVGGAPEVGAIFRAAAVAAAGDAQWPLTNLHAGCAIR
jgi:hypothetical protein